MQKNKRKVIFRSLIVLTTAGNPALAARHECDSIHAVQIAREERLVDCDVEMTRLVGRSSGGPQASFADPIWHEDCIKKTANQCAALHRARPERTLQAQNGGDLAVVFPETAEQCTDGTRPAYYYSPGSGAGANRWVVYLNGSSGRCGASVDRAKGSIVPMGERCFDAYVIGEADSTFLLRSTKNEDGILSDAPTNPFANWNRVHIPSCSNDQYQGQRVHRDILVETDGGDRYTADVFSRGHVIVKDVLLDLARNHQLAAAEQIVLNGASGGAEGLVLTLDALAAYARTLLQASPDAPIVGLIDSRGAEPGIDNSEARFDDPVTTCSSIFRADCGGKGFDHPPRGTDSSGFDFDQTSYLPHSAQHPTWGANYEKLQSWHSPVDADCQTVHGANAPECLDVDHVLFNHLKTPVFIAASISDSNQWNNPIEFLGAHQREETWQGLDCGTQPGQSYIEHARHQIVSYALNRDNAAGGADGQSHGSAPMGIWAPQIWDHVLAHDRCKFTALTVGGVTLAEAFSRWLKGNPVTLIDGYAGKATGSECGVTLPDCSRPREGGLP